jgi:hypothetical protein
MNQDAFNAISYLVSKGITKDVATGICSVLMVESGLNPTAENNTGTETPGGLNPRGSYGIAQWNGPRQAALKAFAVDMKLNVAALTTQLDFVLTECANSYPEVWHAIHTPRMTYAKFIPIFVDYYEDPKLKGAEISKALTYARGFWNYAIKPPTPPAKEPA